jgi:hypothetical protein
MDANRNFSANLGDYTELSSIGITAKNFGRINNGRGMRLRVETGSVWITQDHCMEDVCLKAGESYRIEHDGLTLISTLQVPFALVAIEPAIPVAPTMGERFWNFWASLYAPESRPTTAAL